MKKKELSKMMRKFKVGDIICLDEDGYQSDEHYITSIGNDRYY